MIPSKEEADKNDIKFTAKYLEEQLTAIVESLEDIQTGIKHENNRVQDYLLQKSLRQYTTIIK